MNKFPHDQTGELLEDCQRIPLSEVSDYFESELNFKAKKGDPSWLRYYHYKMEDGRHAYMLFNESMAGEICGWMQFPWAEELIQYDGVKNELYEVSYDLEKGMEVILFPGESTIFLTGGKDLEKVDRPVIEQEWNDFKGPVQILAAGYENQEVFQEVMIEEVDDLHSAEERLETFAGIIRYELIIDAPSGLKQIDLGICKDAAEMWVNGTFAGVRIGYPYSFDVSKESICGKNHVRIEVATTLANKICDSFSKNNVLEPEGLSGPVRYR